jgi:hypothetical protein
VSNAELGPLGSKIVAETGRILGEGLTVMAKAFQELPAKVPDLSRVLLDGHEGPSSGPPI